MHYAYHFKGYPDEKDRANTQLPRALVGITRISAKICEILIVQCPVRPKCAGASGSKINDDGVSTLKQACSGRYSGSLKLSSRRFKRAQNRSAPLLTLFSIAPEVNGLGRYCAVIRAKFGGKPRIFNNKPRAHAFLFSRVACNHVQCTIHPLHHRHKP